MARKPGVPSSREDASRPGRAIVTLTDSRTRKRRTFRLGTFGGAESRERYARVIAQREAASSRRPSTALGDINQDGAFDTADVAAFVQLLVGGDSPSVPEPGTLTVLGLGALALLRRGRLNPDLVQRPGPAVVQPRSRRYRGVGTTGG